MGVGFLETTFSSMEGFAMMTIQRLHELFDRYPEKNTSVFEES